MPMHSPWPYGHLEVATSGWQTKLGVGCGCAVGGGP